ncbi:TrkH family potassium uptake protein [Pseudonocardia sp. C8]|nr:potassium transporter TrkG [Pseudonocardia sp. C8]MBC3190342.1 TrkH family potassium uptake protein [Pseudonocardia sp. C8]
MLPASTSGPESASWLDALFTATSAVCVTGLVTVDTGSYWSPFGQVVILALIQLGGLGLMTVSSLLVVLVSRRLGLRARLVAQAQSRTLDAADIRRVIRNVVVFSIAAELVVTTVLAVRFGLAHAMPPGRALWEGLFHAISAFNNAGFGLRPDSLVPYAGDAWILLTVALAVIVGGLGFPVVFELARAWRRPRTWSVTTRITVIVTGVLLVLGTVLFLVLERDNPATLGAHPPAGRLLLGFFSAVMPRTAGFNALDVAALTPETWLVTDILMFIGGGSAGTAGGIKVTTFGLLAFVLWSEIRGEPDVDVGQRRVPAENQRQALAVVLLGVGITAIATLVLQATTDLDLDRVLFECVSALGTVGLSTGITATLPAPAQVVLVLLMFLGRLGPLTVASALALRTRQRHYRRPEERTIIG